MTDLDIYELRKLAENATPGPWEYGVRWHIQGATHCQCREQYGPLLEARRMNINGQMMDAHIHKRENPWDENGILTGYVEDGHPTHVVIEMEEYGTMSQGDGEYIAAFNPETVKALLDRLERAEAAIERVRDLHRKITLYSHEDSCPDTSDDHRDERHSKKGAQRDRH